MNIDELKSIWQNSNSQLENNSHFNLQTVELIQSQKVKSPITAVYRQRIMEIICHFIALVLLLFFIYKNITQLPYAISGIILTVLYTYLFINCYKQIRLLTAINSHNSVIDIQRSLMRIQTYLLQFMRLSVLFIPTFLSFPVVVPKALADLNIPIFGNFDIMQSSNGQWWYVEVITFLVLTPLGIWFYKQVSIKNMHKKWVNRIIKKAASSRLRKAIDFLNELEALK